MNALRNKLIFSYTLITILIIIAFAILFTHTINNIFEQYAIDQRSQQIDKVISQVNEQYNEGTGLYNIEALELIGNSALQNGIMIHIQTINEEIDWDIRMHKAQECQMLLQHAETNMHKKYPDFKGGYAEDTYELKNNGIIVGYLTAGYYGPYSFDKYELLLLNTLNNLFLILGIGFLFVSVSFGVIMAKRITDPVKGAIHIARKITEKEYGVQTMESSRTKETANLILAINEMSLALEQEEKKKKQITADVAHELRTPLGNLQSHIEAMIDGIWEPTQERLISCHTEILRLNKIVDQLKELYLLENKKDILSMKYFDFFELCKAVYKEFELKVQDKRICLNIQIPNLAMVYGDETRIKQCLINLVSNAINYVAVEGDITVIYEKLDNHTILTVSDNGPGISEEDLPHVFERFYRVDKSRNKNTGGMGIGLAITKAIINAHGGIITVESHVGVGSTFKISLPLPENLI